MRAKRDSYLQELKAKLDELNSEIDRLEAKDDLLDAEMKIKYHKQIGTLRYMQEVMNEKLAKLIDAGDDAWEDIKTSIELALESLESAMNSATSRLQ